MGAFLKGDVIPDSDRILRHVPGTLMLEDGGVEGRAFLLRPADDGQLSVAWMESHDGDDDARLEAIRAEVHRELRNTHRFACLNIDEINAALADICSNICFKHDPLDPDPPKYPYADLSHSVMIGLPLPDDLQADIVADKISYLVTACYPAKNSSTA